MNKTPQLEESGAGGPIEAQEGRLPEGGLAVHLLSSDQLLPARCPLCGAPGVVAHSIALSGSKSEDQERSSVEVHYCDLCAEERSRSLTRDISLKAAWVVAVLAAATSFSLAFGTRLVLLQILVVVVLSCVVFFLQETRLWPRARQGLWLFSRASSDPPGTQRVLSEVPKFADCLSSTGLSLPSSGPLSGKAISSSRGVSFPMSLGFGGLLWVLLIQALGVAQVRVLVGGDEPASLLVDSRKMAVVQRANSEDPRAGRMVSVMGGRRELELVTRGGRSVAHTEVTIWPGRTYIVGNLPTGLCLFWEERKYGEMGGRHRYSPVRGSGPVWELERAVDSWFMPLTVESDEPEEKFSTSGGIRQAIRLLPCQGPSPLGAR